VKGTSTTLCEEQNLTIHGISTMAKIHHNKSIPTDADA
jgi:hypothetical protein